MEFHECLELMDFSQEYPDKNLTISQNNLLTFVDTHRFSVIYKGKQEGVSSAFSAYLLWLLINNNNYKIAMIAVNKFERESFRQLINSNLDKLEKIFKKKGLKNTILTPENHNINFTRFSNGSTIYYWTQNQPGVGRGHNLDLIYISEMSYNDYYNGIINSLMPCIMSSKNSKFIIITTDLTDIKNDFFMNGDGINEYWTNSFSGTRFVIFEKIKEYKF